jgi:hypothetical protein
MPRRLQRPSFRSAGARQAADGPLHERIGRTLRKIQAGGLPRHFARAIWLGLGTCQPCSGCGDPIDTSECEYEVEWMDALVFWFHPVCYRAWQALPADR